MQDYEYYQRYVGGSGSIDWDEIDSYMDHPNNLNIFCKDAKIPRAKNEKVYMKCAEKFDEASKRFGIKIIRPMKILCLRLVKDEEFISSVHSKFF